MRARVLSAVVAGAVLILGPVPSASATPADVELTTVCDPELDRPDVQDRDMKKQKREKTEKRSERERGVVKLLPEVHTPDPDSDEEYRPLRGGLFDRKDADEDGWDDSRAESRKSDERKDKKRFDTNNMSVDGALGVLCG